VWRITKKNQGRHTAGMDKVAIPQNTSKEEQNQVRYKLMNEIDIDTYSTGIHTQIQRQTKTTGDPVPGGQGESGNHQTGNRTNL
jgi:hypothetical protein